MVIGTPANGSSGDSHGLERNITSSARVGLLNAAVSAPSISSICVTTTPLKLEAT